MHQGRGQAVSAALPEDQGHGRGGCAGLSTRAAPEPVTSPGTLLPKYRTPTTMPRGGWALRWCPSRGPTAPWTTTAKPLQTGHAGSGALPYVAVRTATWTAGPRSRLHSLAAEEATPTSSPSAPGRWRSPRESPKASCDLSRGHSCAPFSLNGLRPPPASKEFHWHSHGHEPSPPAGKPESLLTTRGGLDLPGLRLPGGGERAPGLT